MDRVVMWSAAAWPGIEHTEIREQPDAIEVDGLVVAHVDGEAIRLGYRIRCQPDWTTRRLEVVRQDRSGRLVLESDGRGHWQDGTGRALPDLEGCIDVDISVTPFTNTLPIRRLRWEPGQARELLMVYVLVPEMTCQPARQTYTCLETSTSGSTFRYESGSFRRDLTVDPDRLVIEYPGYWRRIEV